MNNAIEHPLDRRPMGIPGKRCVSVTILLEVDEAKCLEPTRRIADSAADQVDSIWQTDYIRVLGYSAQDFPTYVQGHKAEPRR